MTGPRHWWLPSISACLWIAFFLALNLSPQRVTMISADGDPCWHWRQGQWMIQHRALLRADQFSHTRAGAPLVEMWWLCELLFAGAGKLFGWGGIVLVSAALAATTVWLLHRQLLAEGTDMLLATALTLLAAAVCATHWLARPHLATLLLFTVFAWQLRCFRQGRVPGQRLLWLLPALMVVWVNSHGAFVAGLMLVALYLAGSVLERNWGNARTLALLSGACLLASLVNPNGWTLHAHIIEHLRDPLLARFAQEYVSPNFHSPATWPFLSMVLLSLLLFVVARPRLPATDLVLWLAWFALSLRMVRNTPLFALVVTPMLAEHGSELIRRGWPGFARRVSVLDTPAAGAVCVGLAVAAVLGVVAKPMLGTHIPSDKYPVAAVEFVRRNAAALPGQMFNDMNWGGYLMLALPERKIFIHANLDLYGAAMVREYNAVDELQPEWPDVLQKYGVGWTILPASHPLNRVLERDHSWQLVYTDRVAMIFARHHD